MHADIKPKHSQKSSIPGSLFAGMQPTDIDDSPTPSPLAETSAEYLEWVMRSENIERLSARAVEWPLLQAMTTYFEQTIEKKDQQAINDGRAIALLQEEIALYRKMAIGDRLVLERMWLSTICSLTAVLAVSASFLSYYISLNA